MAPDTFIIRYKQEVSFGDAFATALPLVSQKPSEIPPLQSSPGALINKHRWLPSNPLNNAPLETYTLDAEKRFISLNDNVEIVGTTEHFSYTFLIGDANGAALFSRRDPEMDQIFDNILTLDHLYWCLDNKLFSPANLLRLILYTNDAVNDRLRLRSKRNSLAKSRTAVPTFPALRKLVLYPNVGILARQTSLSQVQAARMSMAKKAPDPYILTMSFDWFLPAHARKQYLPCVYSREYR